MILDIHNHVIPRAVLDLVLSEHEYGVSVENDRLIHADGFAFALTPAFTDVDTKLAELERVGISGAVVSISPTVFHYGVSLAAAVRVAEVTNEALADYCAPVPERLSWMAHVPLGYPQRAADVLRGAVLEGAVAVEVGTHVAGRRLDEPEFAVFWDAAADLALPVFIHPHDNEAHAGLTPYYLQNVIGHLLETTLTVERLICSGVFDERPTLQVILAHGGGYYPYQAGRLRHAITQRAELAGVPPEPWGYRAQLFVDTITHDVQALQFLVKKMGVEHVLLGTDQPFDMATPEPCSAVEEAIPDAVGRERILGGNARSLFQLARASEPTG